MTGDSVLRRDAWEKVTGRARYAIDATVPNMAHAAVVRSERAHAYITGIDRAEAESAPGVIAVVTADDLGDLGRRFGHIVPDHAILADGKVRYYGEPVAVVVAETPHEAADAAALVWVDYDDLPALTDAASALASDVLIHEQSYVEPGQEFLGVAPAASAGNVAHRDELAWGDTEAALAEAATVVETTTKFPIVYGYAMETYNALADWQPGSLHVVSTAQHPLMVRKELARMFSLPLAAVRVEVPFIGGGYGSKSYTKLEPLAAAASWAAGRPVKVTTDVEAAMYTTRADGALVTVRTGFDADARITARHIDIRFDTGAYADNSPLVLTKSINRSFGPYRMPNLRVRGVAVYTNTSPASSYRGFGAPQAALAGELNIDMAADRLGIDPVELRRRNLLAPGDTLIAGKRPLDADLVADLNAIVCALDSHAAAERRAAPSPACLAGPGGGGHRQRRRRLAHLHRPGAHARRRVGDPAGQQHRNGPGQPHRAGPDRGPRAARRPRRSGRRPERHPLHPLRVDHRREPHHHRGGPSGTGRLRRPVGQPASQSRRLSRRARRRSEGERRPDSRPARSRRRGAHSGSESGADLAVGGSSSGSESGAVAALTAAEVIRQWFGVDAGEVVGVGVIRRDGATAMLPPFWEIGAVGVEVAVNEATGEVTVEHLVTVGDVGHAVNPDLVKGQDLGAATQGLGIALWEEMVYDGEQLTNPNLIEYRVPRLRDTPRRITSVLAERGDGAGPYGAKGAGEGSLNPVPAAVAAAVGRAVGVWPTELPLTPPRVWSLLRQASAPAPDTDAD